MRNKPVLIDRVAVNPAADLVLHPALCHLAQRDEHHLQRLLVLGLRVITHQEIVDTRTRELGSPAKAAGTRIEHPPESLERAIQYFAAGNRVAGSEARVFAQLLDHFVARFLNTRAILAPRLRQPLEHRSEARTAVAIVRRKIGATEKRLTFRCQPYRHGP